MYTTTNMLSTRQREPALERRVKVPRVLETDRALDRVTRDPFIDGLVAPDCRAADRPGTDSPPASRR
jgi:hypothetical protein